MDILASWTHAVISTLFVIVCVLLILVVLLQKGRGGGLSGAFGGTGGYSAFGAKTGDVFTWVTVALAFLFILMSVFGNYWYVPQAPAAPVAGLSPPGGPPAEGGGGPAEAPGGQGAPAGPAGQ